MNTTPHVDHSKGDPRFAGRSRSVKAEPVARLERSPKTPLVEYVEQASTLKEADEKLAVAIAEAQQAEPKEYFGYTAKYWKVFGIVLAIGLVGLFIVSALNSAKNDEHTAITGQQDEATQVGSGGARVWYLHYIQVRATRPDLPSGIHEVQPYQLGLNYAPQYYSSQIDQEKFAHAFESELNRLIAENPDK